MTGSGPDDTTGWLTMDLPCRRSTPPAGAARGRLQELDAGARAAHFPSPIPVSTMQPNRGGCSAHETLEFFSADAGHRSANRPGQVHLEGAGDGRDLRAQAPQVDRDLLGEAAGLVQLTRLLVQLQDLAATRDELVRSPEQRDDAHREEQGQQRDQDPAAPRRGPSHRFRPRGTPPPKAWRPRRGRRPGGPEPRRPRPPSPFPSGWPSRGCGAGTGSSPRRRCSRRSR